MKSIKDIHKLVERKGGAGAFNRGYGNALEDVLELIDELVELRDGKVMDMTEAGVYELKARIKG